MRKYYQTKGLGLRDRGLDPVVALLCKMLSMYELASPPVTKSLRKKKNLKVDLVPGFGDCTPGPLVDGGTEQGSREGVWRDWG